MFKNRLKNLLTLTVIIILTLSFSSVISAASKTQSAKAAYLKALNSGKIKTYQTMYCALKDTDKDGVPEVLIYTPMADPSFHIYAIRNNTVRQIFNRYVDREMFFNEKTKVFSERGEGDSTWIIDYKLKNDKMVEFRRYVGVPSKTMPYYKQVGTKKYPISRESFYKKYDEVFNTTALRKMTVSQLRSLLSK